MVAWKCQKLNFSGCHYLSESRTMDLNMQFFCCIHSLLFSSWRKLCWASLYFLQMLRSSFNKQLLCTSLFFVYFSPLNFPLFHLFSFLSLFFHLSYSLQDYLQPSAFLSFPVSRSASHTPSSSYNLILPLALSVSISSCLWGSAFLAHCIYSASHWLPLFITYSAMRQQRQREPALRRIFRLSLNLKMPCWKIDCFRGYFFPFIFFNLFCIERQLLPVTPNKVHLPIVTGSKREGGRVDGENGSPKALNRRYISVLYLIWMKSQVKL